MAVHVIDEADRCLQCKKPMCQQGCPIHTPIPAMIKALKEGGLEDAGAMLFANNPMSLVCSLVCNHERQCEGHCVLGRKGQPVHVSSIENYISDTCLERIDVQCQPKNGKKVAVIGAGPAGITIAILLTKKGYSVTIFDSRDKIGGVLQYGIPEFRLPKAILERYKKKLLSMGIRIRPNTTIGGALEIKDLFRDGYKAIFIGTGVWRPKKLGIKGESLGNVHFAIDYLANPDAYDLGDRVAVIGVGNSAMDVARTAVRLGTSEVTVIYRRSEKEMPAGKDEIIEAREEGVKLIAMASPVEFLGADGKVTGIHLVRRKETDYGRGAGARPIFRILTFSWSATASLQPSTRMWIIRFTAPLMWRWLRTVSWISAGLHLRQESQACLQEAM